MGKNSHQVLYLHNFCCMSKSLSIDLPVSNQIFFFPFRQKVFRVIPQNDEQVKIIHSLASYMQVKNLRKGLYCI